ncbi:probable serine/threonine-protein kinase samkC [Sinocyclocheilus rhinocerous]|uniref:probable serine/threonine-protein kinase samkC n=1 Tax=Sinocyclocheilus rhinocerous TaxID=307959 RepID=UPI0007B8F09C|nr:PREDICTED: probable serine/threonine-protein kinase samkC [Sinocyclocheilus rhinocerous]
MLEGKIQALISSGGSFVSGSLATALSTSVRSKTVPKPAQLNYQTVVQTSKESVAFNSQQPVQTGSQSSGQLLANAQSFVKPQRSRLVGSKLFSGGRPIPSSNLGQQSAQASYQTVSQPSGPAGYQAPSQPSSLQSAQASYQSLPQPSALQSAQANYRSMQQPSRQKPGLTRYQPVSQPSGLQSAQASYQSVPLPSGLQSAQANYQSAQAHYPSVSQPSGQSVSLQPGFQLPSMLEQSSYASLSSFGSQPLEQPSNVQLASSYESVLQPDPQDTAPLRSQTTQNERFSPGMLRLLQQVKS